MLYFKVVLTCGLLLGFSMITESLNFKDCGSTDVSVMRVTLSPSSKVPCVIVRGKQSESKLNRDIATELPEIRGSSGHGPQVLQFPEGGIRAHMSPSCPIKARKFYAYFTGPE
ncbi:hypothetical protein T265_08797 [Opisthorchis viverrini]|uniref:MD-2-related lipid-recognition domain-containing protein n=1 Tax=Opisthorchis viverrini TaxID=6198 RepID=A0A074ZIX0_OPIVI|nr:hypothetical protein T265_08797 [Opisthorchis viverrini]KER23285.1 hypothetical protein T265_08797 [Opisthorchis viverrini]